MKTICRSCSLLLFLLLICQHALGAGYKYPGNKQVLVYSPGYDLWSLNDLAVLSKVLFKKEDTKFWDPAPILIEKDHAASLEMVKSFGDYGTVIIHTHGWYWREILPEAWKRPGFRAGTVATWDEAFSHMSDLVNFRIAISKGALETNDNDDEGYHLVVFPSFIDKYVDTLPDTFFYLGYCHGLQNDKMWDVLKSKGAKVAFGFSEAVHTKHDKAMLTALMEDAMLPHETTARTRPLTALEAYTAIPNKIDFPDARIPVQAEFEKKVASPEWNNFVFAEPQVLRIKVENDKKSYFFFWNLDTDEEFLIYDSESGAELTQPIFTDQLSSTTAARYNWSPETGTPFLNTVRTASSSLWPGMGGDSSGAEDANRFISLVFDGPETERPPFSFTAQQTTAEDLVRRSEIVFGGYNEIITNDIHVYNWQEVTFLGSTAILRSTVEDLGDLERLARKFRSKWGQTTFFLLACSLHAIVRHA